MNVVVSIKLMDTEIGIPSSFQVPQIVPLIFFFPQPYKSERVVAAIPALLKMDAGSDGICPGHPHNPPGSEFEDAFVNQSHPLQGISQTLMGPGTTQGSC